MSSVSIAWALCADRASSDEIGPSSTLSILHSIIIPEIVYIVIVHCCLEASLMPGEVITEFGSSICSYGGDDLPRMTVVHRTPIGQILWLGRRSTK